MRGIALHWITVARVPRLPDYLSCLLLHPISVRTELVRSRCYYILCIKANCVQDIAILVTNRGTTGDWQLPHRNKE